MADNDDHHDISIEEMDAIDAEVLGRKRQGRSSTHTLPELMIRLALTPAQIKKLRRDRTTCMIIEAPSAEWVAPLERAAKGLGEWKFVHAAKEPPRKSMHSEFPGEQSTFALAAGGRTLGVSQNPFAYLPKSMVGSADIVLKILAPDDEILREAIKQATGRSPRSMPEGVASGLDYSDICAAIRIGSSAKSCVERLLAAAQSKSRVDPALADVPRLEDLHGYGKEVDDWGQALLADLEAWRAGKLDFSAIDRTVVLASAPGLGKTTFARSLAKSAGIPLIATSVGSWFANGAGYLDSVIKQIDQVFAEAAAVAPALLFLDEIEGIPNRANLRDRGDWWIPVVGHMLLKLDSAASSVSSQLIIMGATNHPEKLDPALVRPGRLSRIIHIGMPDAPALEGILRQHLHGDLIGEDLSLIAEMGVGASGADVTGWVKGARSAARQHNRAMTVQDLFNQVAPAEIRPPDMIRRIAIHEAAHAVVSQVLQGGSVTGITIIGRDPSEGGRTSMTFDVGDVLVRRDIESKATISLAGRCGEQVLLNSVSSGSGGGDDSDLARASLLLALIHTSLGLGDRLLHRASPQNVRELLAIDPALAKTVEADLQRVYAVALKIVEDNVALVEAVADALMKHRHLTGEQFLAICKRGNKGTGGHHG